MRKEGEGEGGRYIKENVKYFISILSFFFLTSACVKILLLSQLQIY